MDTDKNKLTSLKVAPLAPNHHWLTYHRRCQCIWKIGLGTILDIFHFPSFWCNSLLSKEFVSSPLHPQMRATLEMVFEVGNSKLAFFPANSMFPILNIISLLQTKTIADTRSSHINVHERVIGKPDSWDLTLLKVTKTNTNWSKRSFFPRKCDSFSPQLLFSNQNAKLLWTTFCYYLPVQ